MGREATVSWGGPELIFRNDWPAALLMKLTADRLGDHRAVLLAKLGRRVTTTTGRAVRATSRRARSRSRNPSLPPGTTSTVQSAGRVGVHRAVHAPGVQGRRTDQGRALHRALRRAERDRRGRPAESAKPKPPPGSRQRPAASAESRLSRRRSRRCRRDPATYPSVLSTEATARRSRRARSRHASVRACGRQGSAPGVTAAVPAKLQDQRRRRRRGRPAASCA